MTQPWAPVSLDMWREAGWSQTPVDVVHAIAFPYAALIENALGAPLPPNAWGTPHSAIANPSMFTGRDLDEEAGLYFYRARYYDTEKGRFLQRDPLGYFAGMNLYEYAGSEPMYSGDPLGILHQL